MIASTVILIVVSYMTKEMDKKVLDDFYGNLAEAEAEFYEPDAETVSL